MLRELADYLDIQVQKAAETALLEQKESILLIKEEMDRLPDILKKELCHLAIAKVSGSAKDIGFEHIESLKGLLRLQVGRRLNLPYKVEARRVYEGVLLQKQNQKTDSKEKNFFLNLSEEMFADRLLYETVSWEIVGGEVEFSLIDEKTTDILHCLTEDGKKEGEISKNQYTKYFDYDKIKGDFQIRTRQQGDYLVVDEAGHKKRLKEYFINEKIPADKRNEMLLFTQGAKVLWVIGGRISADIKVSKDTGQILKVQITGGKYHES